MTEEQRLDKYVSVLPNRNQKALQRKRFNVFFHYGINTFTGKEWGNGKADPKKFFPKSQDTDQWVKAAKDAGAYGVILTCKHHDGFCLWQTATTDYGVASSDYKNGKGDVVKEVSDSCRKFGLKFGIYLSPWDRNSETYATDGYNDFYCAQLKELLTNYGEIFCVWLDGACGSDLDGKPKQVYDWKRYYDLIHELQPNACISNCGPDVRWVGNENGLARDSEWNVVPKYAFDVPVIEELSQKTDDVNFVKKSAENFSPDSVDRETLAKFDDFIWYPAEVDVSIRPGWFFHGSQNFKLRSLKNLLKIYYTTVGGNSILLLNVPPDKNGLIHKKDLRRLGELGNRIREDEKQLLKITKISAPEAEYGNVIENVLTYEYDEKTYDPVSYYTPAKEADNYEIRLELEKPTVINRVKLVENVAFSQRIENFEIYAKDDADASVYKKIYDGTTVGYGRTALFRPVSTDSLIIRLTSTRKKPYIEFIGVYADNGFFIKTRKKRK